MIYQRKIVNFLYVDLFDNCGIIQDSGFRILTVSKFFEYVLSMEVKKDKLWFLFYSAVFLWLLYWISTFNFLLFHTIVELFSIAVAVAMFVIVWSSQKFAKNSFLTFIGIAFFFIGIFDLLHTLSYEGMGVFAEEANTPTQLWIAARYIHGLTFLIASFYFSRKVNKHAVFLSYSIICTLIILSIFNWKIFPDCLIEGQGLTTFKIISEYIICAIFVSAAILIFFNRSRFEKSISIYLVLSLLFSTASEIFFTLYTNVYEYIIILGHFFKIVAFYLLYRALIKTQLENPYNTLFGDLKKNEIVLNKALEAAKSRTSEVEALLTSNRHVLTGQKFETVAQSILKDCNKLLNIDNSAITMLSNYKKNYTDVYVPNEDSFKEKLNSQDLKTYINEVVEYKKMVIRAQGKENASLNLALSPLLINEQVCGIFALARKETFNKNDLRLISAFNELINISLRDFLNTKAIYDEYEKTRKILDAIPDGIYIVNQEHKIEYINPAMRKIFGSINNRKCFEYLYGYSQPCENCAFEEVIQGKNIIREFTCPSNNRIYDAVEVPFLQLGADQPSKLKIIRDVTESRQMEKKLQSSTDDLKTAQKVAKLGSWRFDIKTKQFSWSDETYRIFGIPKGQKVTYEDFLNIVHPDDREMINDIWKSLNQDYYYLEHRIVVGSEIKWVLERAELEYGENGQIISGFGTTQDITQRKETEEALKRSEAIYRRIADANLIGVAFGDTDGNISYVNDEMLRMMGYTREDYEAGKINWVQCLAPESLAEQKYFTEKLFREGKIAGYERVFIKPDGGQTPYLGAAALVDPGQDFHVSIAIDMTQVHKAEVALRQSEQKLRDLNKVLESRVRDRTYQLQKTVEVLQDEVLSRVEAEKKLLENQTRLRDLSSELIFAEEREKRDFALKLHDSIGQLLSFSKKELGIIMKKAPEDIRPSLEEVWMQIKEAVNQTRTLTFDLSSATLYTLGLEAAIEELAEEFSNKNEYQIHFHSSGDMKDISEELKILIYRTIRELLVNVSKHSQASEVQIALACLDGKLKVRVKDNGRGFDVKRLNSKKKARGYGLFSLEERISNVGGKVKIESVQGKGTEVNLSVPADF